MRPRVRRGERALAGSGRADSATTRDKRKSAATQHRDSVALRAPDRCVRRTLPKRSRTPPDQKIQRGCRTRCARARPSVHASGGPAAHCWTRWTTGCTSVRSVAQRSKDALEVAKNAAATATVPSSATLARMPKWRATLSIATSLARPCPLDRGHRVDCRSGWASPVVIAPRFDRTAPLPGVALANKGRTCRRRPRSSYAGGAELPDVYRTPLAQQLA